MQELRDGFRALRSTPLVSSVLILSLALGIGANTALFSILDAMILRPLPVRQPERLVRVLGEPDRTSFTKAVFEQVRERRLFETTLAWSSTRFDLARGGPIDPIEGSWVSGNAFDALGVRPALGRLLTEADDRPGGGPDGPVVVISHGLWQRRFGGAPDVLGRTLTLDRVAFGIVGVTPRGFTGIEIGLPCDIAAPLATMALTGRTEGGGDRMGPWVSLMARLRPDDSPQAATARLRSAQAPIREATLPAYKRPQDREAFLKEPFKVVAATGQAPYLRRRYERPLIALLALVGLVLAIACANIANLLLARTAARRHELSVRSALGAGRLRLARQLAAESLLLSGAGCLLGVILAVWASRLLVQQLSTPYVTVFLDVSLNSRVLALTGAVGALTALLFGSVPALRAANADPIDALRTARTGAQRGPRGGFAGALAVAQIAISLMVVVAATLFVRSFAGLATRDVGFDREAVLVVDADVRRTSVPSAERAAFAGRIRDAVAAAPGVASASVSIVLPAGMMKATRAIEIAGGPALSEKERTVQANVMTPGWFRTLGIPIVLGRDFDERDRKGAPNVAIVNQAFVHRYLHGRPAIGAAVTDLHLDGSPLPMTVVGVVADAAYHSIREPASPTLYEPLAQFRWGMFYSSYLSVRGAPGTAPAALARSVAAAVARVDPEVSLTFRTLKDQVDQTFAQERLLAQLSAAFGALALLLAALGLYGVIAHRVARRRFEIGIRMALGATSGAVLRLILRHVGGLVGLGIALGMLGSLWGSHLVASLLFGVGARDPWSLGAASFLLAAVALAAGWLPSLRAARVDPMTVLKEG